MSDPSDAVPGGRLDLADAYLSTLETRVSEHEDGGLILETSNFFPTGGGQPGDRGSIELADGRQIAVVDTVYAADKVRARLMPAEGEALPAIGTPLVLHLDWARRYKIMRMHTALHLMTVVLPSPVTGASIGEDDCRIDFDLPEAEADKQAVTEALMRLVEANHPVGLRWITDAELDANPSLVKSANVKPPRGSGRIRLVTIGDDAAIDSQPCGGTHVGETQEIGRMHVAKIEKKGRTNRRFRLKFGEPVA